MALYSAREGGLPEPSVQQIGPLVWKGLRGLIDRQIASNYLAESFPVCCSDNGRVTSTDADAFWIEAQLYIPNFPIPPNGVMPSTEAILDLLEFVHSKCSFPINDGYHGFFQHYHLSFEKSRGQQELRDSINDAFARNGLAYKMNSAGEFERLFPKEVGAAVYGAQFETGDSVLNDLLSSARVGFLDPSISTRRVAVEKLWDAWERLKSLEDPTDKRRSVSTLLDRVAATAEFRRLLETEASSLTQIGNDFHLRHFEANRHEIPGEAEADYLFTRLFALIRLILTKTDRVDPSSGADW